MMLSLLILQNYSLLMVKFSTASPTKSIGKSEISKKFLQDDHLSKQLLQNAQIASSNKTMPPVQILSGKRSATFFIGEGGSEIGNVDCFS